MSIDSAVSSPTSRDPRLDIAKGILIALVVFGHLLEAIDQWQAGAARVPLTAIYLFHMPAFAFVSGMTASATGAARRVATMLLLLAAFQVVYFVTWMQVESYKTFSWTEPFWVLWFLIAMAWWQALAPLVARAPRIAFVISVVIALVAGAFDWIGAGLALSRTVVFLPFFIAGMIWGGKLMARAVRVAPATRLVATLACAAIVMLVVQADINRGWLYASSSYGVLGVDIPSGIAARASLMCVAALMAGTMFMWLPGQDAGRLVTVGRRTLGIYLLHGPLVMVLTPVLGGVIEQNGPVAAWILCLVAGSGLLTLLSVAWPDRWLRVGTTFVIERSVVLWRRWTRSGPACGEPDSLAQSRRRAAASR